MIFKNSSEGESLSFSFYNFWKKVFTNHRLQIHSIPFISNSLKWWALVSTASVLFSRWWWTVLGQVSFLWCTNTVAWPWRACCISQIKPWVGKKHTAWEYSAMEIAGKSIYSKVRWGWKEQPTLHWCGICPRQCMTFRVPLKFQFVKKVDNPAQSNQAGVLFRPSTDLMRPTHTREFALLSLSIQMLMSPQITLTNTPRLMLDQISGGSDR